MLGFLGGFSIQNNKTPLLKSWDKHTECIVYTVYESTQKYGRLVVEIFITTPN